MKFYEFFLIFWNFLKFRFFLKFWNFITPYPWYFDPPTHGISTPLPMIYWPPYPWYIDPPTHGILTPLTMVYWPPYPWYIDPPTHGILTPLTMEYRPPTYGISNPLLWYYELLFFGRNEGGGGKITMRGFKIQWQKIDPRVKIPYGKLNQGSKYM